MMKGQANELRSNNWSVKKPNELSLVVQSNLNLDSPCISDGSKQASPKNNQSSGRYKDIDFKRLAAHKNTKSPKNFQQKHNKNKSAFFQLASTSSSEMTLAVQTKLAAKLQNHQKKRRQPPLKRDEVQNSHLPAKALSYLQMVDEPGAESVTSKFSGYRFQNQFRNPLQHQQKTLFLSQVRANLPKLDDSMDVDINNRPEVAVERCQSPRQNMMSHNQVVKRGRSLQVSEPNHNLKIIASPSSRQPLEDVRARPFHDGMLKPEVRQGSKHQRRCGKSISFVPPRHIQDSINVLQDSIESATGQNLDCMSPLNFSSLDYESKMKIKEVWYYNMDRVNYRPYYHERIGEQVYRKNRLAKTYIAQSVNKSLCTALEQQETSINSQPSFNQQAFNPVGATQAQFLAKAAVQEVMESVIGSAFKVRDIQAIKSRSINKNAVTLPQPTMNRMVVEKINTLSLQTQWPTRLSKSGISLHLNDHGTSHDQQVLSEPASPIKIMGTLVNNNSAFQVPESMLRASVVSSSQQRSPTDLAELHKATGTIEDVSKEVTTQLIESNRRNSKVDSHTPSNFVEDANQSMKLSNSASHQEASLMNMPMNSKIIGSSQTPDDNKHTKTSKISRMSGKTENASFDFCGGNAQLVGKLAGKVDAGTTMAEVCNTPGRQKELVSGSITIKRSMDLQPDPAHQQPKVMTNGLSTLNNLDPSGGVMVVNNTMIPSKEGGGHSTEELSIANFKKQDSQGCSNKSMSKDVGKDSCQLENLAVIEQPKAHVRTSQEHMLARDSTADYEEFRQVGIISHKFSSTLDSASRIQHLETKGCRITSQDTDQQAHSFCSKDLKHLKSEEKSINQQHLKMIEPTSSQTSQQHSMVLRKRIEQLVSKGINMSAPKNCNLIRAYQEQLLIEKENGVGLIDAGPEYIITNYSLPKALTRTIRQTNNHKRAFSQQMDRQRPPETVTSFKGVIAQQIQDDEQFTYQRENRQMLVGPLGRKISKPMACRLQHNLNKRREALKAADNQSVDYSSTIKHQPQSQIPTEVSFRQHSIDNSVNVHGDKVSFKQVFKCQGKMFEVQQLRRSTAPAKKDTWRRQTVSTDVKSRAANNSHLSNSIDSASQNEDLGETASVAPKETFIAPVPRLQLNKVDLQLFTGTDDSGSVSNQNSYNPLSPLIYGASQLNPWNQKFLRSSGPQKGMRNRSHKFVTMMSPQHPAYASNISGYEVNLRTTKMISIDVKTGGSKQQARQQHLAQFGVNSSHKMDVRTNRLRIVTQERSISDTIMEASKVQVTDSNLNLSVHQHIVPTSMGLKEASSVHVSSVVRPEEDVDIVNTGERMTDLDPTLKSQPLLSSVATHTDEMTCNNYQIMPDTILESRETLGPPKFYAKLPTSDITIGMINNNAVCDDTKRTGNERQRSQFLQPQTNDHDDRHSTARDRNDEDYNRTPPSELLRNQKMPNKYNDEAGQTPLFDTSQNQGSLRTLQSRNQPYSKLNKDLGPHHELNVVVKTTSSKPIKTQIDDDNNNNAQSVLIYQHGSNDERDTFYLSNRDLPLETTASHLRYDEKIQVSASAERKELQSAAKAAKKSPRKYMSNEGVIPKDMHVIQTTMQKELAIESLMPQTRVTDYISLKMQTHDPGEGIDLEGQASRQKHSENMSKHTVYQLAAKFGSPAQLIGKKNSLHSQNSSQRSAMSRFRKNMQKSQNSSLHRQSDEDGESVTDETEKKKQSVVDPYWLEKYISLQKKQHARKYDRELHMARQERILASKTAHLVKKSSRQRTPPISRNKLLQVPVKPHNRAKVSSVGNRHAIVESVWAKNRYASLNLTGTADSGNIDSATDGIPESSRFDIGKSRC